MSWSDLLVASGVGTLVLGFISAVLYAILQGKLVPAATHDMVVAVLKEQRDDAREREKIWATSHGELEATLRTVTPALAELAAQGEATLALLKALPPRQT